jgi:hypothetical protein
MAIRSGRPMVPLSRSRIATTRSPVNETPTAIAGLTQLTVSALVKTRKRCPSARPSVRTSRLHRSCGRCAGGGSTRGALANFPPPFGPDPQAFQAVEPVDPLVIDSPPLTPQQDLQPPVAVAHPGGGKIP